MDIKGRFIAPGCRDMVSSGSQTISEIVAHFTCGEENALAETLMKMM